MKFRCKVARMHRGLAFCAVLVLVVSCGSKTQKVTREQCTEVADHIADLIIDHFTANPLELWDGMNKEPGDTGVPPTVTRETFKSFLDSPEGKTWLMTRRGQARSGTHQGIDQCVEKASQKQVKCLLAAKSREDVTACDQVK